MALIERASPRRWRLLALALSLALLPAAAGAAEPAPKGKIDPALLERLRGGGTASFFVQLHEQADLGAAFGIDDLGKRRRYVYDTLTATASRGQARLRRLLDDRRVPHTAFWIVDTILATGTEDLVNDIASLPDVDRIIPEDLIDQDVLEHIRNPPEPNDVSRNVADIHAPEAWEAFGTRGEGIVVANIDTGVQFDHPALLRGYRGRLGGVVDHNYNWFEASLACANGVPCDTRGHGTFTMGVMVGQDDGAGLTTGVAPGARWIAAKGCGAGCSPFAVLKAAEWILAPTDLHGNDPRPELAPDIVNNSWGYPHALRPAFHYKGKIDAWTAAGIFSVFAIGNDPGGAACDSSWSPGDYPNAYGVGALDTALDPAFFSRRGPGVQNVTKPDIAAPGFARSSVPPEFEQDIDPTDQVADGYANAAGTSVAAPHVAGVVALMWSANPALRGDVARTRQLLDGSAVDVDDTSCGGTADDNNVVGEGRVDALDAVAAAVAAGP
jgi:subtilisin family serine protease